MKRKSDIVKLQEKIWILCKLITRKKYGNTCYTCGKSGLAGRKWQTGHVIPKKSLGAYLKYDTRLLRPQCFHCNINLGGNGARFIEKIRRTDGDDYADKIFEDLNIKIDGKEFYPILYEQLKSTYNEENSHRV